VNHSENSSIITPTRTKLHPATTPIWTSSEKSTTRTTQINLNNHLQARSTATQTKPNTNQPRIKTQKLKRKIIYLDETNFCFNRLAPIPPISLSLSLSRSRSLFYIWNEVPKRTKKKRGIKEKGKA
jgi:hypothetical protein